MVSKVEWIHMIVNELPTVFLIALITIGTATIVNYILSPTFINWISPILKMLGLGWRWW